MPDMKNTPETSPFDTQQTTHTASLVSSVFYQPEMFVVTPCTAGCYTYWGGAVCSLLRAKAFIYELKKWNEIKIMGWEELPVKS